MNALVTICVKTPDNAFIQIFFHTGDIFVDAVRGVFLRRGRSERGD